jgi:hypothetical protein
MAESKSAYTELVVNLNERAHLEDLGVGGRITLKQTSKKLDG